MKRSSLFALLTCMALLTALSVGGWLGLTVAVSRRVQAEGVLGASTSTTEATPLPYPVRTSDGNPNIRARYYALYNPQSGKLLDGRDAEEPVPIASTTKMMTAYVITRIGNLDDIVTISSQSSTQTGSSMELLTNEKISVRKLMQGALIVSGNDAAYALAEYGGGILLNDSTASSEAKVARFVQEMNDTASLLMMQNTKYADPTGLNDEGKSTALDLAKLGHHTLQVDVIEEIVGIATTTVYDERGVIRHDLRNSNRLVADYNYWGVVGGKTGFTLAAGHCLMSAAERDGMQLLAVVLNTYANTNNASADEVRKLLDWGFTNWKLE